MIKEYQVAAGVKAFSTTRKGGVSQGNYGEFNINEFAVTMQNMWLKTASVLLQSWVLIQPISSCPIRCME